MNWDRLEKLLFTLAVMGTTCWAIASLSYPMGYDQGMMAGIGDVIVRGGLPYRDGFEFKGPVAFYLFALAQKLFGRVMWGIRLLDLTLLVTSAACFYSVLKRMLGSAVLSRWLALCLVLAAASRSWFHVSQPDGWGSAFVIIAIYLSMGRPPSKIRWLAAGFLIGASALIKPFYILLLVVPIAMGASGGLAALMMPAIFTAAGAVLPVIGMAAWFGWNGALGDLIEVHFLVNLAAYSGTTEAPGIASVVESIVSYLWNGAPKTPAGPFGVLLIPIVAGVALAWRERRTGGLALLLWLATAIACVAVQRKFFVYHWLIAFPPLLAIAGFALARISTGAYGRAFAAAAIGLFLTGVAIRPAWDTFRFARYAAGLDSRENYFDRFERFEYRPWSAMNAAAYIKAHSRPDEGVVVFGVDTIVQYLSERASPTRFLFSFPLGVPNESYRNKFRTEFLESLHRAPPRYIVLGRVDLENKENTASQFQELAELLRERYQFDQKFGLLELYRLNDNFGSKQ